MTLLTGYSKFTPVKVRGSTSKVDKTSKSGWELATDDGHLSVSIMDKEAREEISLNFDPDTPVMVCRANGGGPAERKFAKKMTVADAINWINSRD